MNRILFIIVIITFLSSCAIITFLSGYGDWVLNNARKEYTCRDHGGHYKKGIEENNSTVTCRDGSVLNIEKTIKDPKYYPKK